MCFLYIRSTKVCICSLEPFDLNLLWFKPVWSVCGSLVVVLAVVTGSLVVVTSIGPWNSFSYVRYPNPIVSSVIITILPSGREKTYSAALPRTLFASRSKLTDSEKRAKRFFYPILIASQDKENYKLMTDLYTFEIIHWIICNFSVQICSDHQRSPVSSRIFLTSIIDRL